MEEFINKENSQETDNFSPKTENSSPTLNKKKNSLPTFLSVFVLLFATTCIGTLIYLYVSGQIGVKEYVKQSEDTESTVEEENNDKEEEQSSESETEESEEAEILWTNSGNTYMTATLPDGWTLKEKNLSLSKNDSLTGYPGAGIYLNDKLIIEFYHLIATGFECAYTQITIFPDSKDIDSDTVTMGSEDTCGVEEVPVVRISDYSKISLLNNELRRVDTEFYVGTYTEDGYYETQDPLISIIVDLINDEGLELTFSDGYNFTNENSYFFNYDLEGLTEEELEELDQILESIDIVELKTNEFSKEDVVFSEDTSSEDREYLAKYLIEPYLEYNNSDDYYCEKIIQFSIESYSATHFGVDVTQACGGYTGFSFDKETGNNYFIYYIPECTGYACEFSEEFANKYPQIVEEYQRRMSPQ